MSPQPETARRHSSRRSKAAHLSCPACHGAITAGANRCPSCQFTGADTMGMFPGNPPPLLPILDVANVWNAADVKLIENACASFRKKFPQFHWRFAAVDMPPTIPLNILGFWLLNAATLLPPETQHDRAWTVLLILNRTNGNAAVIPGYAAEPWITDLGWRDILRSMREPWRMGDSGKAVVAFLSAAQKALEREWKNIRLTKS